MRPRIPTTPSSKTPRKNESLQSSLSDLSGASPAKINSSGNGKWFPVGTYILLSPPQPTTTTTSNNNNNSKYSDCNKLIPEPDVAKVRESDRHSTVAAKSQVRSSV